jgi:DNA polymerase III alpha subunit
MRLDQFSNPIFNENDLIDALYQGQRIPSDIFVDSSIEIKKLAEIAELKFLNPLDESDINVADFDAALQSNWHMPDEYKQMDIEGFLVSQCPKENYQRLIEELQEFRDRDMINLLRWLKYFVDICTEKNIVWGLGRGSSVASYVLYLIGVHSIDPIKYNLDWREFLR